MWGLFSRRDRGIGTRRDEPRSVEELRALVRGFLERRVSFDRFEDLFVDGFVSMSDDAMTEDESLYLEDVNHKLSFTAPGWWPLSRSARRCGWVKEREFRVWLAAWEQRLRSGAPWHPEGTEPGEAESKE